MSIPFSGRRLFAARSGVPIVACCAMWLVVPVPACALTLPEVEQHILTTPSPGVRALDARARALREQAGVERSLPPPQLILGVEDLPVEGAGAGSLPPDGDGMVVAGLMQMFPSGKQRELKGSRFLAEAEAVQATARVGTREALQLIRLTYIDLWQATEALILTHKVEQETHHHVQALDAAYRTGRATLAERDAAAINLAMAQDAVVAWEQQRDDATARMARWLESGTEVGELQLPVLPEVPAESVLLDALSSHPDLQAMQQELVARQFDVDAARAGARPDWRLEARYGLRGDMPDTATVMVGVDLPLASGGRRRQQAAGALLGVEEGEANRQDRLRELHAVIVANSRQYARLRERLAAYDGSIVETANRRADAALAGYRSGRDSFGDVADARIAAIDIEQKRLALQADLFRVQARLLYFAPDTTQEISP